MRRGNNRECIVCVSKLPYTLRGIPVHKDVENVLRPIGIKISFQTLAGREVVI